MSFQSLIYIIIFSNYVLLQKDRFLLDLCKLKYDHENKNIVICISSISFPIIERSRTKDKIKRFISVLKSIIF